jgi:hypothetical protein
MGHLSAITSVATILAGAWHDVLVFSLGFIVSQAAVIIFLLKLFGGEWEK